MFLVGLADEALIRERCIKDKLGTKPETLKYFRLHLNRGINHLSGTNVIKADDLLELDEMR